MPNYNTLELFYSTIVHLMRMVTTLWIRFLNLYSFICSPLKAPTFTFSLLVSTKYSTRTRIAITALVVTYKGEQLRTGEVVTQRHEINVPLRRQHLFWWHPIEEESVVNVTTPKQTSVFVFSEWRPIRIFAAQPQFVIPDKSQGILHCALCSPHWWTAEDTNRRQIGRSIFLPRNRSSLSLLNPKVFHRDVSQIQSLLWQQRDTSFFEKPANHHWFSFWSQKRKSKEHNIALSKHRS